MLTIPKKNADVRIIGLGASFWRILLSLLCDAQLRSWDARMALDVDSAAAGRSCEDFAIKRLALMETAAVLGKKAALALWGHRRLLRRHRPRGLKL